MTDKDILDKIRIIEKPEWISFDDIHKLLYDAHESNRERGFHVKTAEMSGEEIEQHIGEHGKCFVALLGDKLIGTISYRIIRRQYWCISDSVVDQVLIGIIPEYKGLHVSEKLWRKVYEEAKNNGYKSIELRTAEKNSIVQQICLKEGFHFVDFKSYRIDHYTVVMMKWIDECPYSDIQFILHYQIRKLFVKLRYKPGKVKRFGL